MVPVLDPNSLADRIVLPAELSAMECLPAWIERLAGKWAVDNRTHYAIHLCLEEAVSNVIRHGYAGNSDGNIVTISCCEAPSGHLLFTVEDTAPLFDPLSTSPAPLLDADGGIHIGGRGLDLLRGFANSLTYEPISGRNRLHIGFALKKAQSTF